MNGDSKRRRSGWLNSILRLTNLQAAVVLASFTFIEGASAVTEPPTPPQLQGAILVILDTVRADRLSTYGHHRKTSPAIDALAEQGVVFEQAISTAPWTLPSIASMLSARWLNETFADGPQRRRLKSSLVEPIRRAGYATAAFTEGGYFSQVFALDQGFSTFQEEQGPVRLHLPGQTAGGEAPGSIERTFRAATGWLREHAAQKFFLIIHTYEAHTPYRRHHFTAGFEREPIGDSLEIDALSLIRRGAIANREPQRAYVRALYDSGLREVDGYVGELMAELTRLGLRDRTMVVITSDHGEELGDRYPRRLAHHGHALTDDQLRVPLVISNPAARPTTRRVPELVRTIDILPTIAELLGVEIRREVDGQSLVELMTGANSQPRAAFGGSTNGGPGRFFVRTKDWKYIESAGKGDGDLDPTPPRVQLYDLGADPDETHNVASSHPDVVELLSSMLGKHRVGVATPAQPSEVPPALEERLRSLGYIE